MDAKLADAAARSGARARQGSSSCGGVRRLPPRAGRAARDHGSAGSWEAPEPNPYFLTRLDARLREEREAAPAGWFARLRARFVYGPRTHVRPLAAMAMTVMLLVGGGAYLGVTDWDQPRRSGAGAVVHDLQTMDSNAQLLDQLEALSNSNDTGD